MKNLTTHHNWLREEIIPPLLRRTGERVNRLQRDWSRDFGFQTLILDKAFTFWRNTHRGYYEMRIRGLRRVGQQITKGDVE